MLAAFIVVIVLLDVKFGKAAERNFWGYFIQGGAFLLAVSLANIAEKIGANKSYISRIEKGQIEPEASTFLRIIDALGLRFEIVKPMTYALQPRHTSGYLSDVETPEYGSTAETGALHLCKYYIQTEQGL